MRVIEVRVERVDFADALGKMRSWLDGNGSPLIRFETATVNGSIAITAQFADDPLGEAFARDFGGSLE